MKHLNKPRKFHRRAGQRKALLQALTVALIMHKKIKTTEAKAKELRPIVEKMITKARIKSVHTVRMIRKILPEQASKILFDSVAPKYKERQGGYVRIIKLGQRKSDASSMAQIEFV